MDVRRFNTADRYEPDVGWERVSLAESPEMSLEWFRKPPGHSSPFHDHEQEQVCMVLEGELIVHTESDSKRLGVYDAVHFASAEQHRVENPANSPAIGLDMFVPGRSFDFWTSK